MTIDALVWVPRMYRPVRRAEQGLPEQWFTATILLRDIAVIVLMASSLSGRSPPELGPGASGTGGLTIRAAGFTGHPTRRRSGCRGGCRAAPPSKWEFWMQVAIALFPRNTTLDAVGPYDVLQRVPSIEVVFVGAQTLRSDNGMLGPICDATFDDPRPDVLLFPGGMGNPNADP